MSQAKMIAYTIAFWFLLLVIAVLVYTVMGKRLDGTPLSPSNISGTQNITVERNYSGMSFSSPDNRNGTIPSSLTITKVPHLEPEEHHIMVGASSLQVALISSRSSQQNVSHISNSTEGPLLSTRLVNSSSNDAIFTVH
jgi:cell division protein YceG involved in septum cleavage